MRKIPFISWFMVFVFFRAAAQDSSAVPNLSLSAYCEIYYVYDAAEPANNLRPDFFYSHNRHNEVNLNLALISANYSKGSVRGNLAFMGGTYAQYNLASEPALLRHVFEANAGVKLSRKNNLWFDAGILPSHIGFESAIGKDCWTLTRSILADNSPYYEAGARISYTNKSGKIYASALFLNGWQRIQRVPGNQTPAFGTQLTMRPGKKVIFNWSSFAGNLYPDSVARWRYFNNLFCQLQPFERVGIIAGFDIGMEQTARHSADYHPWYSPVLIVRYRVSEKWQVALRGEYYSDPHEVVIRTGTPHGFQTSGVSVNVDFKPARNVLCRLEARGLGSRDAVFTDANKRVHENYFVSSSVAISF